MTTANDLVFNVPGSVAFDRGYRVAIDVEVSLSYPSEPGWYAEYIRKDGEGELIYVGPFKTRTDALASGEDNAEFEQVIALL